MPTLTDQMLYDTYISALAAYKDAVPVPDDPSADAWFPYTEDRTKYALHAVAMAAQGQQLEYA